MASSEQGSVTHCQHAYIVWGENVTHVLIRCYNSLYENCEYVVIIVTVWLQKPMVFLGTIHYRC